MNEQKKAGGAPVFNPEKIAEEKELKKVDRNG